STREEIFLPLIGAVESGMNGVLALDPDALRNMARFQGKVIAIELLSAPARPLLTLFLFPGANGIEMLSQYAGDADTTLSGTPFAMAKMSLGARLGGPDASEVMFAGEVVIRGDIELGQRFKRVLDKIDIDWEEHVSRITGDIVAHKLGELFRFTGQWLKQTNETLQADAAEYLQMESESLPEKYEVAEFVQQVDVTRNDVERLYARVQRLQIQRSQTDRSE
ncbi:MAG: SCP2 sterol-binding domain-containing protein, partial [Gammaproteobacteria bacterium]|nr:SCP2 sterol-binding domain-containing protein [Gammaproteobacteria bacterium]